MKARLDASTPGLAGLAALLLCLALLPGCFGDPWPRPASPRGDAGRVYAAASGAIVVLDVRTGAVIRRVAIGVGAWDDPPAVRDGMLYAAGAELSAIDEGSGNVVWRLPAKPGAGYQGVAVDETRVYFELIGPSRSEILNLPESRLAAVERATGRPLWTVATPRRSPVFPVDGVVVTREGTIFSPKLVGRDAATGATRWTVDAQEDWDPQVAPGRVFMDTRSELRELDAATGRETWRSSAAARTVALGPDTLYLRSGDEVAALDLASKLPRWKQPCPGWVGAGDDLVVCATTTALARRADTGAVVWQLALPAAPLNRPVVAEGVVLLYISHRELWAVDAGTGTLRWKLDPMSAASVTASAR
jgi:outer membrane protein assembly factor BamB